MRPLTKMQRLSKAHPVYPLIGPFKSEYIVTDIDNEKIIPPLKLMTKSEVMNDLFKLSDSPKTYG